MNIDIAATLGATHRSLEPIQREGRSGWRLTATRIYDTEIADAWDALTNPERIPRWFLPISGDLKVGGTFQFEGNAGGEILRCEPPTLVAVTWGMHGDTSWVTVTLAEHEQGTELVLEHEAHVPEEMWNQFGPGAVGIGWELAMMGLGVHFETNAAVDPAEGAAFATTPDGRAFVTGSSEGWAEAWIAAGADPDEAKAAAKRVESFYTGQAPPTSD